MTSLEDFFAQTNPEPRPPDPLRDDLMDMIKRKAAANPRNLQRALGPSQVGHPCMRKMAFGMMEVPRSNPEWDCLPSAFGVAMHSWLEDAAHRDNQRLGRNRWIIETRVEVTPGLSGTADLYDTDTHTVIDWKNLGYTSFDAHVRDVGDTYRNQVQLYGRGFQRLGYPVREVAIAMLPRSGTLGKMHLERMPYSEETAMAVLRRRDAVIQMLMDFDVENYPDRYQWFPNEPQECFFCPYWRPNANAPIQCDGKVAA